MNDNTEVIAFALQSKGYTVGIPSLGSQDTVASAVSKGHEAFLNWINEEIKSLGEEQFFHADYEGTLVDAYGFEFEDSLVVESGLRSKQINTLWGTTAALGFLVIPYDQIKCMNLIALGIQRILLKRGMQIKEVILSASGVRTTVSYN